jgi:hypothetical protein
MGFLVTIITSRLATIECGSAVLKDWTLFATQSQSGATLSSISEPSRDGVFNPGRNLGKDLARYESVALQSAERLRQGLLADAFDLIHDAGEAHGLTVFGNHAHGPERPFV